MKIVLTIIVYGVVDFIIIDIIIDLCNNVDQYCARWNLDRYYLTMENMLHFISFVQNKSSM